MIENRKKYPFPSYNKLFKQASKEKQEKLSVKQ